MRQWGYRCTILNLGGGQWSASRPSLFAPAEGTPPPPISRIGGWSVPEPVWTMRRTENSFPPTGNRFRSHPASSLLLVPTVLSRLQRTKQFHVIF
jgi:hypothetical protein